MNKKERKQLTEFLDKTPLWELLDICREIVDRVDELLSDDANESFNDLIDRQNRYGGKKE